MDSSQCGKDKCAVTSNKGSLFPLYVGKEILPPFVVFVEVLFSKEKSFGKKGNDSFPCLPQDIN